MPDGPTVSEDRMAVLPQWVVAEVDRLRGERDEARAERDRARDSLQAIFEGGDFWQGDDLVNDRAMHLRACEMVAEVRIPLRIAGRRR